jgi:hypothetical protein
MGSLKTHVSVVCVLSVFVFVLNEFYQYWCLCWMSFLSIGIYVEWILSVLAFLLNEFSQYWCFCWMSSLSIGVSVGHFKTEKDVIYSFRSLLLSSGVSKFVTLTWKHHLCMRAFLPSLVNDANKFLKSTSIPHRESYIRDNLQKMNAVLTLYGTEPLKLTGTWLREFEITWHERETLAWNVQPPRITGIIHPLFRFCFIDRAWNKAVYRGTTSRKVTGSMPDEIIYFYQFTNSFRPQ